MAEDREIAVLSEAYQEIASLPREAQERGMAWLLARLRADWFPREPVEQKETET